MNTTGWTLSNATRVYDGIENQQGDLYDSILGDYYIQVIGDADLGKYIETTLTSSDFVAGSNYIIAAWAKGDVTPNKHYDENPDGRAFGIYVTLSNGTSSDVYYFEFDSDIESWQYQASKIYVDSTITSINVKVYYRGEGTVYFDGIQMYNEAFGTKYAYDAYGNTEYISTPESSGVITYEYDANNRFLLDKSTDQNNKVTGYNAYTSGLFKDISQNNVSVTVNYNNDNQIESVIVGEDSDNDGVVDVGGAYYQNFKSYSTKGQYISQTKDEFGSEIDYTMELLNGLLSSFANEIDITTSYTYDEKGRVETVSKNNSIITYHYTGDLLDEIQMNGMIYKLEYDNLNRLEYVYIGTGTGENFTGTMLKGYLYEIDIAGNVTYDTSRISEEIFGNADQIKITYNDENQLEGLWFYESNQYIQRYSYEYNQSGNLTVLKDLRDNQEYYYNYDLVGRIKKVTNQDGDVISYEYDNAGNLHIYTFDIAGFSRNTIFSYDLTSGIYDKTEYGDVTKNYTFETDDLRRLIGISITIPFTTINTISYSYLEGTDVTYGDVSRRIQTITQTNSHHYITQTMEYNAQGYITKITDFSSDIVEYYYDAKDQLIRENNEIDDYTYTYAYDNYGNLGTQSSYDFVAGNNTLGTVLKTEVYTYDSTWKDKISTMVYTDTLNSSLNYTLTFSYDDSGNVTGIDDTRGSAYDQAFIWEGRSLISQTIGSTSITYTYDQNGIRDSKTIGSVTTTYYLNGSLVLYETDGTNQIYYTYDVDGSLISMRYNGTEYFYIFDVFGNVTYLVDSSGYTVVYYRYDAYGNIIDQTSSALANANPYRYRSYRYDQESGLYYLQSRYYNPVTGRFINADGMLKASSTVLSHNMFIYTENNPVNYRDDSGYAKCFENFGQFADGISCNGGGGSGGLLALLYYAYKAVLGLGAAVATVYIVDKALDLQDDTMEKVSAIAAATETNYSREIQTGYYVYVLYENGNPYYVGITKNLQNRFANHALTGKYIEGVTQVATYCGSKCSLAQARVIETGLILGFQAYYTSSMFSVRSNIILSISNYRYSSALIKNALENEVLLWMEGR
jgi:RHS repeat-associated protein